MDIAKVAIVTGASSGIGRQSAIALSKAGWTVVLTARRETELEEAAKECPSPTLIVAGDIAEEAFVQLLFEKTVATFGRLDLLFNNAGTATLVPVEEVSAKEFRRVLDINLVGSFIAAREAIKIFKSQDPQGGRIINNGSLSAHVPRPNAFSYTCSKHAITGLTKSIALDGRPYNITCTQIDIGNAHTAMAGPLVEPVGTLQGDGRLLVEPTIDVEHVANTIVYIASLPPDVAMLEVNIMAAKMPYVGRG